MGRRLFGHIRGNVVAYAALFVALGGTAVAATALPANSVGTAQLKNGAVTGQKVANNTLTGANINESTLGTVPDAANLGGLSPSAYQRRIATACSSGQAIQAVDATGSPTCQAFGQGTVTSVGAGTGLTNSGTTTDPVLNVDSSAVQSRVSHSCSGSAIGSINSDGTVTCNSTFTQFMGGTGSATTTTGDSTHWIGYLAPVGLTASPSTTYSAAALGTSAAAMTAGNLSVIVGTPPGNGNTWLFEFRINNLANGGFECAIADTATSCSDTSSSISIPAGAKIALEVFALNGSPPATTVSFGWTGTS